MSALCLFILISVSEDMYVYLDESGDLGFGPSSSKCFVITLLIIDNPLPLGRIVKRIRKRRLKKTIKELPEIKFNNSNRIIREAVLRDLRGLKIEVRYILLDKKKVYEYLREEKHKLYNFVSGVILSKADSEWQSINLIVDKRTQNRLIREDFDQYIKKLLSKRKGISVAIDHIYSHNDPCLQVTDFVSGAIFRKYESGDDYYYRIIEDKIGSFEKLFEQK